MSLQSSRLLKLRVSSETQLFDEVPGKVSFSELNPVQTFKTIAKFAKLLEDGQRLENLNWRLTFLGLASLSAGCNSSNPKQTPNRVKTLVPQFSDGVLLHTTVSSGDMQEGMAVVRPLVEVEVPKSPGSGNQIPRPPPPELSGGGVPNLPGSGGRLLYPSPPGLSGNGNPSTLRAQGEFESTPRQVLWLACAATEMISSHRHSDNENQGTEPHNIPTPRTGDASTSGLPRGTCTSCHQREMKCDGAQPACGPCSRAGVRNECSYHQPPPLSTDAGVETRTSQGPSQRPATRSRRNRRNPESKNETAVGQRTRQRTRARSWDRSSRSGSISEGHQSPEDEVESKKKVDWCDPQWEGPVDHTGVNEVATAESSRGSQVSGETGTPSPSQKSPLRRPKLARSALQFFFAEFIQRAQANTTDKLNVKQAAKEAGREYANLSATEKEKYQQMSRAEKVTRERELAAYMSTLTPEDIDRENAIQSTQRKVRKSGKSSVKDQNAPQKPPSGFFVFLQRVRSDPKLVKEIFGDEVDTTRQTILASAEWRSMTDDERKPFLAQAEQEKLGYEAGGKLSEGGSTPRAQRPIGN